MSRLTVVPLAFGKKSRDLHRARAVLIASTSTPAGEKELLARVPLAVHRRDTMHQFGGEHYLSVGLSALACIETALGPDRMPATILDFASGYGRVLRFLTVRFPDARITASEVEARALRFCGRAFDVSTHPSGRALDSLRFPARFDLIWCGSLITHLARPAAGHLMDFFGRHLSDSGVCVFSAHGEVTEGALRGGSGTYGLAPTTIPALLTDVDETGYGYADYPGHEGYGISLVTRDTLNALARQAGLAESSYQPRAWDDHHDVYGFVRS